MVKRMLGITAILLLNTFTHLAPYPHSHSAAAKKRAQEAPQQKKPKKNILKASVHEKEPDVETVHSHSKKKLQLR